jgi:hypothetical protein
LIPYISSAYIASTFDAISAPYRRTVVADWIETLEPIKNMTVSEISSSLPLPVQADTSCNDLFKSMDPFHQNTLLRSYTPYINRTCESLDPFAHIGVVRGLDHIPLYTAKPPPKQVNPLLRQLLQQMTGVERDPTNRRPTIVEDEQEEEKGPYANCTSVQEMVDRYMNFSRCMSSKSFTLQQGMPIPYTYPDIFPKTLNENGYSTKHEQAEEPKSVPMLAHVQTTPALSQYLQVISSEFERVAIKKRPHPSLQLSIDELKERKEQIYNLMDAYEQ